MNGREEGRKVGWEGRRVDEEERWERRGEKHGARRILGLGLGLILGGTDVTHRSEKKVIVVKNQIKTQRPGITLFFAYSFRPCLA